jgi:hypothetical protein
MFEDVKILKRKAVDVEALEIEQMSGLEELTFEVTSLVLKMAPSEKLKHTDNKI